MHLIEAKEILSAQNGMNVYRGCTHGCIYCDSRSRCYRMDHPFEDIAVKRNAPELLRAALLHKRKKCMIGTGSMSDPYIPLEREQRLTRRCLEVIRDNGFGLAIQTKSDRILDDFERLQSIHDRARCVIQMTLTTADDRLCSIVEPNVCRTKDRLKVLDVFREAGIPTVVWLSPILPFINDTKENIASILHDCADVGVKGVLCFGMGLTLREGNREYFYDRLDASFPGIKEQYIQSFGYAYSCASVHNDALMRYAEDFCDTHGMLFGVEKVFAYLHEMPEKEIRLF